MGKFLPFFIVELLNLFLLPPPFLVMNELNSSILKHSGGVDANDLRAILDDFDITKDQSHEHLITSKAEDQQNKVCQTKPVLIF